MDAFEQDRAYARYRRDPNVRHLQLLQYVREICQGLLILAASVTAARFFNTPSPERAGLLLGIVACSGNLAMNYLIHGRVVKDVARAMVREDLAVGRRLKEASAEGQADRVIASLQAKAIATAARRDPPKRGG